MPIVTFTTDFGAHDGYVGALKGVVLSIAPQATLVDIAHGVPARDVAAGAVALAQAAPLFPPGTIHVVVVDPGVGGARADLVVAAGDSFYVGPDNGVLSLAARGAAADLPDRGARVSARAGQPDLSRPRRVRAGRGPAGRRRGRLGRRPAPRIDGGAERAAVAPARRRDRGGGDSRRRVRQPHHLAAGRGGRAGGVRRDGGGRGGGGTLRASAGADVLRRRDRARSSPTSAAAASWRSPAATAPPRAASAPSAGRSSACGARPREARRSGSPSLRCAGRVASAAPSARGRARRRGRCSSSVATTVRTSASMPAPMPAVTWSRRPPTTSAPDFFAGIPIEDLMQGPRAMNTLEMRMASSGLLQMYTDGLEFDVLSSYEVARCVRGRTVNGQPDYLVTSRCRSRWRRRPTRRRRRSGATGRGWPSATVARPTPPLPGAPGRRHLSRRRDVDDGSGSADPSDALHRPPRVALAVQDLPGRERGGRGDRRLDPISELRRRRAVRQGVRRTSATRLPRTRRS